MYPVKLWSILKWVVQKFPIMFVAGITNPVILEMDFMESHNVVVNFDQQSIKILNEG